MESDEPAPVLTEATASGPGPNDMIPEGAAPVAPDSAALVAELIASSEWPDPELFARIVAAGEAALEPLLAFVRTYPREYEREFILENAIDLLGMIGSPAAIPELVEMIRRYPEDIGEMAAEVLGEFGPIAFEPALELVRDPAIVDYPRLHAIQAARQAAGADPELRARLAEVLRPMLAEAMDRVRAKKPRKAVKPPDGDQSEGAAAEDGEGDDLARGDAAPVKATGGEPPKEVDPLKYIEGLDEIEAQPLEPDEEVIYLVEHLADMADPDARELIKTAFAEDLVDPDWVDEKFVDDRYREGGAKPRGRSDRLQEYRVRYAEHIEYLKRPPTPTRPFQKAGRSSTLEVHAGDPPPQEPIRNTGPKVGRNDPCWCGSGKKYKKCHLGKDDSK